MYSNIQSMKNQGFSKRHVADKQAFNFRTVSKYWDMTQEEIEDSLCRDRCRDLSLYEGVMTDWLKKHPDLSASQVQDWLKEHYHISTAERTVRRFVEKIREDTLDPEDQGQGAAICSHKSSGYGVSDAG